MRLQIGGSRWVVKNGGKEREIKTSVEVRGCHETQRCAECWEHPDDAFLSLLSELLLNAKHSHDEWHSNSFRMSAVISNTGTVPSDFQRYAIHYTALLLGVVPCLRLYKSYPCTGLVRPMWGQGVETPRISRKSAYKAGKVVSHTHRPPLLSPTETQERSQVVISVTGWVDPKALVWPEGLSQLKIQMTTTGIKPATFRLVV